MIDKLSSKNNILINENGKIYDIKLKTSNTVAVSVLYEVFEGEGTFRVQQQEYTIKNDNTITYEQKTIILKSSV